jgi:hypothetical protein
MTDETNLAAEAKPKPYHHGNLRAALIDAGIALLRDGGAATLDLRKVARQAGLAYVSFAHDEPFLMREMYSGLTIDRSAYPSLYAVSKSLWVPLVATLQQGQAQGLIGGGDVEQLGVTVWSLLHGLAMLLVEQQFPAAVTSDGLAPLVSSCLDQLLTGLRAG